MTIALEPIALFDQVFGSRYRLLLAYIDSLTVPKCEISIATRTNLVILVSGEGEKRLALKSVADPSDCPISGEQHQLPV